MSNNDWVRESTPREPGQEWASEEDDYGVPLDSWDDYSAEQALPAPTPGRAREDLAEQPAAEAAEVQEIGEPGDQLADASPEPRHRGAVVVDESAVARLVERHEAQAAPVEEQELQVDEELSPVEEPTLPADEQAPSIEEQVPSAYESAPPVAEQAPSVEEQVPSAYESAPLIEDQAPAVEPPAPQEAAVEQEGAVLDGESALEPGEPAPTVAAEESAEPVEQAEPEPSEEPVVEAAAEEVPAPGEVGEALGEDPASEAEDAVAEQAVAEDAVAEAAVDPEATAVRVPEDEIQEAPAEEEPAELAPAEDESATVEVVAAAGLAAAGGAVAIEGLYRPEGEAENTQVIDERLQAEVEEEERLAAQVQAEKEARDQRLGRVATSEANAVREAPKPARRGVGPFGSVGLFLLRLVVAGIIGVIGYQMLASVDATAEFLSQTMIPEPRLVTWIVGFALFVMALFLVVGLAVRAVGLLLAVFAGCALAFIRWGAFSPFVAGTEGFLGDRDLLLATIGLLFFTIGGGRFGIDGAISKSRAEARAAKEA